MKKKRDEGPEQSHLRRHLQGLRTWIERSGKTLREVAEASEMSLPDLSATLREERPLMFAELLAIIVALGKEPRDFFLEFYGEIPTSAIDALWPPTTSSSGSGSG